jgi:hypothetical protein
MYKMTYGLRLSKCGCVKTQINKRFFRRNVIFGRQEQEQIGISRMRFLSAMKYEYDRAVRDGKCSKRNERASMKLKGKLRMDESGTSTF